MAEPTPAPAPALPGRASYLYLRHRWPVRLTHWINVLSLTILLMSGLMIFNAHPSLDWGKQSYSGTPSFFEITSRADAQGRPVGVTRLFGHEFETTGVLGISTGPQGGMAAVAFPGWITIPSHYSLAEARLWHFFFAWLLVANGLVYVVYAVTSRHLRRDLAPTAQDWRGIGRSIRDHLRFKHPQGEDARHYNVLQKLAYLTVIFVLLPLIVLAGWAMSPWLNSLLPGWVDVFGGRQSARSIHFIVAWLLVGFVAIHVFEVLVSGVWNHLRSMISGRYRIDPPVPEPVISRETPK
ncbi:MAG: cytochrome b/b6 domain-containing protein [Burkholderiaceae bacterium]